MNIFLEDLSARLVSLHEQGQLRQLVPINHGLNGSLVAAGQHYLNLAGNDYLGLATDETVYADFYRQLEAKDNLSLQRGLGSTASRLMTGNTTPYTLLEAELAAFYQSEAALVFNSGYHLNVGLLPALTNKEDLILADKLCHASLIDGMRLSRAKVVRYPHADYVAIERILCRERERYRQVFLVTESIFSMDGDCADLVELVRLKKKWQAVLYLDEAHGIGLRGEEGRGLAEEQGVLADIDLFVGACGKAYSGLGAFVIASKVVVDFLINSARPQIFSTGLPPVNVEWLRFVLKRIPTLLAERRRVADLSSRLRAALAAEGLQTLGTSNIVPVVIGDAIKTVALAEALKEHGYWVMAIRPPTVPQGTSRLRLSLNASMRWEQLEPLPRLIARALTH